MKTKPSPGFLYGLAVVLGAAALRFTYLLDSSDNPSFLLPVVDSLKYWMLAEEISRGASRSVDIVWQPFFYPHFLAALKHCAVASVLSVKIVQAVLGTLTCLLTYLLGLVLHGRFVGAVAAAITAAYGPLIFFEGELVACGWAALWSLVLLFTLLGCTKNWSPVMAFLLGAVGAIGVLIRPTFLIFVCASVATVLYRKWSEEGHRRSFVPAILLLCLGAVLVLAYPAHQFRRITGQLGVLPTSGGVNLYIGNNADPCTTINARPGREWRKLTELPRSAGIFDPVKQSRFFLSKVVKFAVARPIAFVTHLIGKGFQFLSSRELPRNVDMYVASRWSRLLSMLTWKLGSFGFPFGVLLPLAIVGLIFGWRDINVFVRLFAILYPLSVILVFVSSRYRTPVIPVMAIVAAVGISRLMLYLSQRQWKELVTAVIVGALTVVAATVPGPFCQEQIDYHAELYRLLGFAATISGQPESAPQYYRRALEIRPDDREALYGLAFTLDGSGHMEEAAAAYTALIEAHGDDERGLCNLGRLRLMQGRRQDAEQLFRRALNVDPDSISALYNLGVLLGQMGKFDEAERHLNRLLKIDKNRSAADIRLAEVYGLLGNLRMRMGDIDKAIAAYERSAYINPDSSATHIALRQSYEHSGRTADGLRFMRGLSSVYPRSGDVWNSLGVLHASMGELISAVSELRRAVVLEPKKGEFYFNLAGALARMGELEGAHDVLRDLGRFDPKLAQRGQQLLAKRP